MRPHARHWEALLLLVSDFERAEQPEWQTLPPDCFAREIAPRLLESPADAIQAATGLSASDHYGEGISGIDAAAAYSVYLLGVRTTPFAWRCVKARSAWARCARNAFARATGHHLGGAVA